MPTDTPPIADATVHDGQAFSHQQRPFECFLPAVTTQTAACGDYPMTRDIRPTTRAHDVAYRSRRPWPARQSGDVPVRGHTPGRNPPDGEQNAAGKGDGSLFRLDDHRKITPVLLSSKKTPVPISTPKKTPVPLF
jgi:hypothetical protein